MFAQIDSALFPVCLSKLSNKALDILFFFLEKNKKAEVVYPQQKRILLTNVSGIRFCLPLTKSNYSGILCV